MEEMDRISRDGDLVEKRREEKSSSYDSLSELVAVCIVLYLAFSGGRK